MTELISREISGAADVCVGLAWYRPGDVHLLHHHPRADEWYYVISGTGLFTVDGVEHRAEVGSAMFIPAGIGHRVHNDSDQTLHIAWGFNRGSLQDVGIVWEE